MPPIFQYWDTGTVPDDVAVLVDSFRGRNPDLDHRVFSEHEAERFIASRLSARERDAFRACAIPAMQADYFRYCAALADGGVWADVDLRCRRALRPLLEGSEGVIFLRPDMVVANGREAQRMENAFFAFREPGHPLLKLTVEIATANLEDRLTEGTWPTGEHVREAVWLTTGQSIFTFLRYLRDWGSSEALVEAFADTIVAPFVPRFCELVGDQSRVEAAFDGVRVAANDEMLEWVAHPGGPLAYKDTDRHWLNSSSPLFRERVTAEDGASGWRSV
jgi:hypothetical protein